MSKVDNPFDELGDMAAFADEDSEAIEAMGKVPPTVDGPIDVEIGIDECFLRCWPSQYTITNGYLTDSDWFVCARENAVKIQRVDFRTFHSAANYAFRLRDAGLLSVLNELASHINDDIAPSTPEDVIKASRHAEAHAHECDAVYPAGTLIEVGGGPNIIDETGTMRAFMTGAPQLQTARDVYGRTVCKECNEETVHQFPASDDS